MRTSLSSILRLALLFVLIYCLFGLTPWGLRQQATEDFQNLVGKENGFATTCFTGPQPLTYTCFAWTQTTKEGTHIKITVKVDPFGIGDQVTYVSSNSADSFQDIKRKSNCEDQP
ncbi:hypothetical protein BXP70_26335 [Hymenobacter crusticola]|uniref:Uncharacterized protein n=1 Tax=Hymenobacter crusticola TaxID=1770526 RepID=A0A243W634_9BACT|nr:hypothetical protein BXP70_26335 [Hymenobacter crusticola]